MSPTPGYTRRIEERNTAIDIALKMAQLVAVSKGRADDDPEVLIAKLELAAALEKDAEGQNTLAGAIQKTLLGGNQPAAVSDEIAKAAGGKDLGSAIAKALRDGGTPARPTNL